MDRTIGEDTKTIELLNFIIASIASRQSDL